jgi:integral membrane protein
MRRLEMADITPLQRFRVLVFIQGTLWFVMIFIALPLKYIWNISVVTSTIGLVYSEVMIMYFPALIHVFVHNKWNISQGFFALVAPIIPFAAFLLDAKLRRYPDAKLSFWGSLYVLTWIVVFVIFLTAVFRIYQI